MEDKKHASLHQGFTGQEEQPQEQATGNPVPMQPELSLEHLNVLDFSPSTEVGIIAGFLTIPVLGIGSAILGLGEVGFFIAAVGATIVGISGKVIIDKRGGDIQFSLPELNWEALFEPIGGRIVEGTVAAVREPRQEPPVPPVTTAEKEIDTLFQTAREIPETTTIPRLQVNDIVRNTEPDSFQVCIGRSLTKKGNPPVWINFYGQHLKLIGASQYGKSSMAAAILYLITRTHKPSKILIALLDMEDKTSKLFADVQHIAEVNVDGKWVTLHAKNRIQVLEHLGHCVAIMDERYTLSEEEVELEPILLVYLEEFLALKDYFKRLIDSLTGEAKENAKKDYTRLVFNVSELARRGLKVKIQLLLCAQVDYRDDDFQEALVNITGGMSFNVRSSAAQAAGFVRTDLLKQNEKDDKKGQAVVETPDCKDLVLAPEYNLKKKLLALDKARQAQNPIAPSGKRPSMVAPANTHKGFEQEQPEKGGDTRQLQADEEPQEEHPTPAKVIPILPDKGVRADTIDLTAAIHLWNVGFDSERKLMKAFPGLTLYQAGLLRDRILEQAQEAVID